jgi:hypothetical protein
MNTLQRSPKADVTQELLNSIHVTPKLILDSMPAYAEKYLPFAMASSLEVTVNGRVWTCWAGGEDGPNAFLLASYSDDQGKSWRDPVFVIDPQAHGLKMGTRRLGYDNRPLVVCLLLAQAGQPNGVVFHGCGNQNQEPRAENRPVGPCLRPGKNLRGRGGNIEGTVPRNRRPRTAVVDEAALIAGRPPPNAPAVAGRPGPGPDAIRRHHRL